jgi:hypothetical protein
MTTESRHWHPSEDDLILHFYGEGQPETESRIDDHLRSCLVCRAAWHELRGTLELVDAARLPDAPVGFENVMWARVEQALMRPVAPPRSRWSMPQLLPIGALAAVVVAAVTLGVLSLRRPAAEPPSPTSVSTASSDTSAPAKPDRTRERVLLTALDGHLEQTELLLVELMNAPEAAAGDLEFERTTADGLLTTGRLYRLTAEQAGYLRAAQMLEDLEPVLVDVARSPDKVDKKEFEAWRERIGGADLLFKVRALGNDIRERKQDLNAVIMNEGDL